MLSSLTVLIIPPPEKVASITEGAHVVKRMARIDKLIIDPNGTPPKGAIGRAHGGMKIFVYDLENHDEEK